MKDEHDYNRDDAFEDAMAAYKEVAAKTEAPVETKTPAEPAAKPDDTAPKYEREQPVKFSKDDPKRGDDANKRMYPERARAADGKFTSKDKTAEEAATTEVKAPDAVKSATPPAATPPSSEKPADAPAPAADAQKPGGPPPSYSVKTKAEWDNLPEHVRADILKREVETSQGLAALKDFKDLKPYSEMAKQHNTTIKGALDNYVGIERLLRQDFPAGIAQIVKNYGMQPAQAAQVFAGLAQRYGAGPQANPSASTEQQPSGDPVIDMLRPVMAPLMQEITALKSQITGDRNAAIQAHQDGIRNQQLGTLAKAIEVFSSDPSNKFYPDLQEQITKLFESGMTPLTGDYATDLKVAYDTAARMHPEVSEALIEQRLTEQAAAKRKAEQEAADKAKFASRSITGSRVPGTVVHHAAEANDHDDVEADVRRAIAQTRRA